MPSSSHSEVFAVRPPTPEEVDFLSTIGAVSSVLGAFAFVCVVGAALAVAVKTRLPGRWAVLFSLLFLAGWWAFEQLMGGNLEMVFGPVALLVTYAAYSATALAFSVGYLRICFAFLKGRTAGSSP